MEKDQEKVAIPYKIKATELLSYSCYSKEKEKNATERELFVIDNKWYFLYAYTRTDKVPSYSLREITPQEYNSRKRHYLMLRDFEGSEWQDQNENASKIILYQESDESCVFNKSVLAQACIFMSNDNPLKKIFDRILAEKELRATTLARIEKEDKYKYSRECGGLSKRYGITFVNVLRLGTNVFQLKRFKVSYEQALNKARSLPLDEQRYIYQTMFQDKARIAREDALKKLGIEFFNADVRNMDFSELEKILIQRLDDYVKKSEEQAIKISLELEYPKREEIFKKLCQFSRNTKREALKELGVDITAININFYPMNRIKKVLAQTLGFEYEQ